MARLLGLCKVLHPGIPTCETTILVSLILLTAQFAYGDLVWDAGGDGVSTFQEANWLDTVTGADPPAGTVNPGVDVSMNVVAGLGATVGGGGATGNFDLGDGFSITLNDDAFGDTVRRLGCEEFLAGALKTST